MEENGEGVLEDKTIFNSFVKKKRKKREKQLRAAEVQ